MAYGQTGSGKTHTVLGLLPLLLRPLLQACADAKPAGLRLRIGAAEVYREEVRDLLLAIEMAGPDGGAAALPPPPQAWAAPASARAEPLRTCAALVHHAVCDAAGAARLVQLAAARRVQADNGLNAHSSRSHMVRAAPLAACSLQPRASERGCAAPRAHAATARLGCWNTVHPPCAHAVARRVAGGAL